MNEIYFSGYADSLPNDLEFLKPENSLYINGPKTSRLSSSHVHNQMASKPKRSRTAFSTYQINELEMEYRRNSYMHRPQRIQIAERLSLPERIVKIWFQNRRTKEKKLQRPFSDKRPAKLKSHTEQRAQHEIVQRLMSYSDPKTHHTQQSETASRTYLNSKLQNRHPAFINSLKGCSAGTRKTSLSATTLLTPPPTPGTTLFDQANGQISDILNFLESSSVFQGGSSICNQTLGNPNDLDIVLQAIRNDLKQQSQQHNTTPSINMSWGQPVHMNQPIVGTFPNEIR